MPNTQTTQNITTQQAANAIAMTAMYNVFFNRLPDAEGLAYWMNALDNGSSLHDVARSFGTHIEPFAQNTTAATIDSLYFNALEVHAPQSVINHWSVLAITAVPSFELGYELTLKLIGQPTDEWAGVL